LKPKKRGTKTATHQGEQTEALLATKKEDEHGLAAEKKKKALPAEEKRAGWTYQRGREGGGSRR